MKKTNKMLAGLVIGTMAFAGLGGMPVDNANLSAGIQNVAYADVNTNNIKLVSGKFDYETNIYTLEFSGISAKNLGQVQDFVLMADFDGDIYRGNLEPGNYSVEDKNGKMVVSFPGQNMAGISLVFKDLYLGVNFKTNQCEKVVLDRIQALNLKSYKAQSKQMLFDKLDKSLLNKQEIDYINKIIDRGDSIVAVTSDYRTILDVIYNMGEKLDQMASTGNYTTYQLDAKTHELFIAGLEEMMPSLKKAPKQAPKKEAKKETPKKENKKEKNLSQVEKLKASIDDNKIITKAAQLLLDTVPDLNKEVTTKLQNLIKKSDALIVKAEKALEKLEKAGK